MEKVKNKTVKMLFILIQTLYLDCSMAYSLIFTYMKSQYVIGMVIALTNAKIYCPIIGTRLQQMFMLITLPQQVYH